jgi:putative redox protein
MKHKADVTWKEGMAFEASTMGFNFMLDTTEDAGGTNLGPKPKTLLLAALGGCTGMDVISILKKMRIEPDYFNVEVEGELSEEHPKVYHTLQINYIFRGKDLPMDKLEKAVSLSQERYCAVTAMLGKSAKISHKIIIEK